MRRDGGAYATRRQALHSNVRNGRETYLRVQPDNQLVVFTVHFGKELVAVLPLVRKQCWYAGIPVVKLAGAANVHSVRFEIVRKQGIAGEAALPLIWQLLKSMAGWDILELPVFPEHGACQELMALASLDGFNYRNLSGTGQPNVAHATRWDGQTHLAG